METAAGQQAAVFVFVDRKLIRPASRRDFGQTPQQPFATFPVELSFALDGHSRACALNNTQGTMRCQNCGAESAGIARICVSCGKPLPLPGARRNPGQHNLAQSEGKGADGASSYLRYGMRLRAYQLRRTRHLTATTQRTTRADANRADHRPGPPFPGGDESARTNNQHANAGAEQRTEPRWNDTAAPPRPGSACDERAWQASSPDGNRKRRAATRFWVMAGIFAVGAIGGLGGALWVDHSRNVTHPADTRTVQSNPAPSARVADGARPRMRGISPGELPYDGAPPPEQAAPYPVAPSPPANDSSGSPSTVASGGPGTPGPDAAWQAAPAGAPSSRLSAQPGSDVPDESATGRVATRPKAHRKTTEKKVARASSRRHLAQDAMKDREIERIRQQAEEELKKKPDAGHPVNQARAEKGKAGRSGRGAVRGKPTVSLAPRATATHAMLARCERIDGLIDREKCKWRVCGGRWGQHGCPSYAAHTSLY